MLKELGVEILYGIAGLALLSLMGLAMWKSNRNKKKAMNNMEEADPELVKAALAEMEDQ